jgi:transposase InsO family protein
VAFDFQFDQPADGRALKLLNIVDEFTRESLVMLVERGIDADVVVATLERLVAERGAPELLRCDNGPEMTAHALRDWCVLAKTGTAFIEPGSPWQNPFVESFHSRVRDELLDVEEFSCLADARVVIGDWQQDYKPPPAPLIARDARTRGVRRLCLTPSRRWGMRPTAAEEEPENATAPPALAVDRPSSAPDLVNSRVRAEDDHDPQAQPKTDRLSRYGADQQHNPLSRRVDRRTGSGDPPV